MAPRHQSIHGQVPLSFFTPYRLRSLTQFLSPCSLSQDTFSGFGRRGVGRNRANFVAKPRRNQAMNEMKLQREPSS